MLVWPPQSRAVPSENALRKPTTSAPRKPCPYAIRITTVTMPQAMPSIVRPGAEPVFPDRGRRLEDDFFEQHRELSLVQLAAAPCYISYRSASIGGRLAARRAG